MASNDRCPREGNYHQLILVGLLSLFVNPVQADWVAGVTSDVDTHGVGGVSSITGGTSQRLAGYRAILRWPVASMATVTPLREQVWRAAIDLTADSL